MTEVHSPLTWRWQSWNSLKEEGWQTEGRQEGDLYCCHSCCYHFFRRQYRFTETFYLCLSSWRQYPTLIALYDTVMLPLLLLCAYF